MADQIQISINEYSPLEINDNVTKNDYICGYLREVVYFYIIIGVFLIALIGISIFLIVSE